MRSKFILALLAASLTLSACGGIQSAVIRSQALSYDDLIEDTTDKLLLLNILRAKDKAPLHFDEIPTIHESIQATAGIQAIVPFGTPNTKYTGRNTVNPTFGIQMTPTFDVAHLDTKDFVTGIASAVDAKFVKYWLDRGLDRRIVLLLFFSSAIIAEVDSDPGPAPKARAIRIMNSPRDAIDTLRDQAALPEEQGSSRCDALSDFQHYLRFIDTLGPLAPHYEREPRKVALNVQDSSTSLVKDITSIDPDKYQVRPSASDSKNWDIYALSEPKTTLCPVTQDNSAAPRCIQLEADSAPTAWTPKTLTPAQAKTLTSEQVEALTAAEESPLPAPPPAARSSADVSEYCKLYNGVVIEGKGFKDSDHPNTSVEIRLQLRSVGEMIQFLGDLLEYQDELNAFPPGQFRLHDPLTFGYCADEKSRGCDDIFFNLPSNTDNSRFSVQYRGRTYAVPNYNTPEGASPSTNSNVARDHTLEVLSVLHQMVDLQKSAQDIRETPYVQILP